MFIAQKRQSVVIIQTYINIALFYLSLSSIHQFIKIPSSGFFYLRLIYYIISVQCSIGYKFVTHLNPIHSYYVLKKYASFD